MNSITVWDQDNPHNLCVLEAELEVVPRVGDILSWGDGTWEWRVQVVEVEFEFGQPGGVMHGNRLLRPGEGENRYCYGVKINVDMTWEAGQADEHGELVTLEQINELRPKMLELLDG